MNQKSYADKGLIQKKNKTSGKLEWYARIVRVDGSGKKKEYTAKAESKAHARKLREELATKYDTRGENAVDGRKLLFRQAADVYQQKRLFKAVYHGKGDKRRKVAGVRALDGALSYLKVLREHFGSRQIKNISHSDIESFKIKRLSTPTRHGNERSISDVNSTLSLLRTIMKFCKQEGWITNSPFELGKTLISRADEVRRERTLSLDEERRLIDACVEKRSHLRPLVMTAVDTAMRRGELIKLAWEHVDLKHRTLKVIALNTKTARPRTIALTDRVYNELEQLWNLSDKEPKGLVFGIKNSFKKSFISACKDAQLEDFHFHDLRHTSISRMIKLGFAPMEIMKISGHSQINIFSRYVNPNEDTIRQVADKLTAYHKEQSAEVEIVGQFAN